MSFAPLFRLIKRTVVSLAVVAACLLSVVTAWAGEPDALSFGLVSVMSAEQNLQQWRPVMAALESRLKRPVTAHTAQDYAGIVWALRNGRDQLAWLGNKSAIEAVDNAHSEVFAQAVYPNGQAGYQSFLIVAADSSLKSVDELFAKAPQLTFAMGDRNSTSGYLVPMFYLFARQGDPEQAFRRLVHGNHEDNFKAVAEGRADVAAVASNHLETFSKMYPELFRKVRVLWRSPQIPGDPLVWRQDLPDGVKKAVSDILLNYGEPVAGKSAGQLAEERQVLARMGVGRFIASDNRQLLPIRRLELFSRRMTIKADPAYGPEDRARRLAEIDRDIERLEEPATGVMR